jgi:hypothetical protein
LEFIKEIEIKLDRYKTSSLNQSINSEIIKFIDSFSRVFVGNGKLSKFNNANNKKAGIK